MLAAVKVTEPAPDLARVPEPPIRPACVRSTVRSKASAALLVMEPEREPPSPRVKVPAETVRPPATVAAPDRSRLPAPVLVMRSLPKWLLRPPEIVRSAADAPSATSKVWLPPLVVSRRSATEMTEPEAAASTTTLLAPSRMRHWPVPSRVPAELAKVRVLPAAKELSAVSKVIRPPLTVTAPVW